MFEFEYWGAAAWDTDPVPPEKREYAEANPAQPESGQP